MSCQLIHVTDGAAPNLLDGEVHKIPRSILSAHAFEQPLQPCVAVSQPRLGKGIRECPFHGPRIPVIAQGNRCYRHRFDQSIRLCDMSYTRDMP